MTIADILRSFAAPLVSLALVLGAGAEWRAFHQLAGDPNTYHADVRAAAARLPERFGDWTAVTVAAPGPGVSLREPNLRLAREFRNSTTGQRAKLTIIQCRDAIELQGYWPPVRYPAEGWALRANQPRSIQVQHLRIPVTVYRFTIESSNPSPEIVVYNFVMRPGGKLQSGLAGVHEAEDDPRMGAFGAALLQVAFDGSVAPEVRDDVFHTLVGSARPVIDAVLGEVGR